MSDSVKKTIIVIDDSVIVREMLTLTLTEAGYVVHALDSPFASAPAIMREKPAMVLLDVSMPGLDGDRIVEIMRRNNVALENTAIILHSDKPEAELAQIAQRCGADGYIQKTMDADHLLRQVKFLVAMGPKRS